MVSKPVGLGSKGYAGRFLDQSIDAKGSTPNGSEGEPLALRLLIYS